MSSNNRREKGFTLIELVVVIAILAILAAFALPRFAQLSEQAHQSSVQATAGALSAGVALAKAQWATNGLSGEADDIEGFGKEDIDVSEDGWPVSVNGANNPSNISPAICAALWQSLLQSNAPSIAISGDTTDYVADANGSNCEFTYQLDGQAGEAGERRIAYDASTGEVITNVN